MPIQYHCPSCGQPIEVDDDAANQPVTCPYCRRISTAPPVTAANFDAATRPAAGPSASGRPAPPANAMAGQPSPYSAQPPIAGGNKLGWWSLGLISAAVVLMVVFMLISVTLLGPGATTQDSTHATQLMQEKLEEYPTLKLLSTSASCILPLTAMTFAIISLARGSRPKWPAYTTLGIVTGGVLLMCIALALQASLGSGV